MFMRKRGIQKLLTYVLCLCVLLTGFTIPGAASVKAEENTATTTVYFLNTDGWSDLHAYVYSDAGEVLGSWPGTAATEAAEMGDNWWKAEVPLEASVTPFNIIFNSGASQIDNYISNKTGVYVTASSTAPYTTKALAQEAAGVSDTTTTVYFYNSDQWNTVYVHAYTGDGAVFTEAWPGRGATGIEDNWWKIDVPLDASVTPFNIIFTDNGSDNARTDNYITGKASVYLTTANDITYSSKEEAQAAVNSGQNPGENPGGGDIAGSTRVYFLNSDGWSRIMAYVWAEGNNSVLGGWPGTAATEATEMGDDWWEVDVPLNAAATPFNIIITDNGSDSARSENYIFNKTAVYLTTAKDRTYTTKALAEEAMGGSDETTVYFYDSDGWSNIMAYVYSEVGNVLGDWPGTAVTKIEDNWWKVDVPVNADGTPFHIIITDNTDDGTERARTESYITGRTAVYLTKISDVVYESKEEALGSAPEEAEDSYDGAENTNTDYLNYNITPGGAGAVLPYTVYEAEQAGTNAKIFPKSTAYLTDIQSEASGRQAVKLANTGDYVEFTLTKAANALVLRYCMPDSAGGAGVDASLSLYANGTQIQDLALTSRYAWVYGDYPYNNNPGNGKAHRFFDESRTFITGGTLPAGTKLRLQKDADDSAGYYIIDFIEGELAGSAASMPAGSLSITDYGAVADDGIDDYAAIMACIAAAGEAGKEVWIPAGTFDLTQLQPMEVNDVTIRGAGMWYSRLYGAGASFHYMGTCKFYDFAMTGVSNARRDKEDLAGFEGVEEATDVTIQNIWMEHMKVGIWSYKTTNLVVQGCRIRNTYADGINLCSATNAAVVRNNTLRGTGDDAIAIWPWKINSSNNTIKNNTVQLPMLANGIAIYGGTKNKAISNAVYDTINNGSGICVGTDYVTHKGLYGTTTVTDNLLTRCGSYHCDYQYPIGAIWIWSTKNPMDAVFDIRNNTIIDSSYEGILIDCWNTIAGLTFKNTGVDGCTDGVYIRGTSSGEANFDNVGVTAYSGKLLNNEAANFTVNMAGTGLHAGPVNNNSDNSNSGNTNSGSPNPSGEDQNGQTPEENPQDETILAQALQLNITSRTIAVKESFQLQATISPSNAADKKVTYSSNSSAVTVTADGKVTGIKAGSAVITASTSNGKQATCMVTVKSPVASVKLDVKSKTLGVGETFQMKATVKPAKAINAKVTYKSGNTKVAMVNAKGKVTAKAAGSAVITASTANGKQVVCKITVKKAPSSIKLNAKKKTLAVGKTFTVKVTLSKSSAGTLSYTSNDKKVITVSAAGKIKAVGKGRATVTVKTYNGKKAKIIITVK